MQRMTAEVPPRNFSYTDGDQKKLMQLLEIFGKVVSLQDIASAYCESGRDINGTVEILSSALEFHAGTSSSSKSEDNTVESTSSASMQCPSNNVLENAPIAKSKPKKCGAAMGTVSTVIGKDYTKNPRPQPNGLEEMSKPVKLNSDDFPVSSIWDEKSESTSSSQSESMDTDIQEFLYQMLGDGFQLEMSVIQEVIGQCGYNMAKSIDQLLDMSASILQKSDEVVGIASGDIRPGSWKNLLNSTEDSLDSESRPLRTQTLPQMETKKKDIQREVLEALFSVPDIFEQKQETTRPIRQDRRQSPYGRIVDKPLEETIIKDFTFITRKPVNDRNDLATEQSYEDLRKDVTKFWINMKIYYKASLDAFINKDYANAEKLLQEGKFYMRKAREVDELSAQELIQNSDEKEEFTFHMHDFEPRAALKLMKRHVTPFCGWPSIPYIKAVVGSEDGDKKDDRKRKRLITKLLEKEGIPWTEEGDGWIISIRSDEIDPSKFSFADKSATPSDS